MKVRVGISWSTRTFVGIGASTAWRLALIAVAITNQNDTSWHAGTRCPKDERRHDGATSDKFRSTLTDREVPAISTYVLTYPTVVCHKYLCKL